MIILKDIDCTILYVVSSCSLSLVNIENWFFYFIHSNRGEIRSTSKPKTEYGHVSVEDKIYFKNSNDEGLYNETWRERPWVSDMDKISTPLPCEISRIEHGVMKNISCKSAWECSLRGAKEKFSLFNQENFCLWESVTEVSGVVLWMGKLYHTSSSTSPCWWAKWYIVCSEPLSQHWLG